MVEPATSQLLLSTDIVCAGRFHVAVDDPRFELAGQISNPEFVFPRRGVWIEHSSRPAFIAEPTLVTFYNGGESYRRLPISDDGDRCDWYAIEPRTLREMLAKLDPAAADRPDPFRFPFLKVDPTSLLLERSVAEQIHRPDIDALRVEETILAVLYRILSQAYELSPAATRAGERSTLREAVGLVRCSVLRDLGHRWTLGELAACAGLSPFQLCRAFRRSTGRTVHGWILDLRLRESLERLLAGEKDLAALALDLGFWSHSHFTTAFGAAFGTTPSAFRAGAGDGGGRGWPSEIRQRPAFHTLDELGNR